MAKETLPMAFEAAPSAFSSETAATTGPVASEQGHRTSPLLRPSVGSPNASAHLPQQQQLQADCMPCKIVGCAGFGGLGLYSFYQAQQLPKNLVARRLGLGLMGSVFLGAAVYRLTMPIGQDAAPSTSSPPAEK